MPITFQAVENLGILKRFQRDLYLLTGLGFDFIDAQARHSILIRAYRKYSPFCRRVNRSRSGHQACEQCTRAAAARCVRERKPVIVTCHLGLVDVYIPVVMHGETVGICTTGQFKFTQPLHREFRAILPRLAGLGLNPEKVKAAYVNIPVITKVRLKAIVDLIQVVGDYIMEAEGKLVELDKLRSADKIQQARDYIDRHYGERVSLAEVAAAVHISASRLAHLFRERLRLTFTDYVNDVRLDWVKFYLANSSLTVAEVAYKVGFGNISHFNHMFRRKMGFSPRQFQAQLNSTRK